MKQAFTVSEMLGNIFRKVKNAPPWQRRESQGGVPRAFPETKCTPECSEKRHFLEKNATQRLWLRGTAILEPLASAPPNALWQWLFRFAAADADVDAHLIGFGCHVVVFVLSIAPVEAGSKEIGQNNAGLGLVLNIAWIGCEFCQGIEQRPGAAWAALIVALHQAVDDLGEVCRKGFVEAFAKMKARRCSLAF